jgi:hypothetical protein
MNMRVPVIGFLTAMCLLGAAFVFFVLPEDSAIYEIGGFTVSERSAQPVLVRTWHLNQEEIEGKTDPSFLWSVAMGYKSIETPDAAVTVEELGIVDDMALLLVHCGSWDTEKPLPIKVVYEKSAVNAQPTGFCRFDLQDYITDDASEVQGAEALAHYRAFTALVDRFHSVTEVVAYFGDEKNVRYEADYSAHPRKDYEIFSRGTADCDEIAILVCSAIKRVDPSADVRIVEWFPEGYAAGTNDVMHALVQIGTRDGYITFDPRLSSDGILRPAAAVPRDYNGYADINPLLSDEQFSNHIRAYSYKGDVAVETV